MVKSEAKVKVEPLKNKGRVLKATRLHILARWVYRVGIGVVGVNTVLTLILLMFTGSNPGIPTLDQMRQTYLVQFAVHNFALFSLVALIIVGVGIAGFFADRALSEIEIDASRRHIAGLPSGVTMKWDISSGKELKSFRGDRPYERMRIADLKGLTSSQKAMLMALGAVED